ncbi:2-isopropylmalate synthase [Streptomyces sp. enrichment culture]|uniref:hypothetical protein n=1 Tax=Streptomyces sp. enrichment culture TaxID=1795815 RepID=UPI003F56455E
MPCAGLAVPAGAQRIEGCLFGTGERTGNVGPMTLTPDPCARDADPTIAIRGIDTVRDTAERCDRLPAHPRHPHAGEPVRTALRGTHRNAIGKGPAERARRARGAGVAAASVRTVPSAVDGAAR